jgi:CubicO group peptidase (beta-lactamase class C family)
MRPYAPIFALLFSVGLVTAASHVAAGSPKMQDDTLIEQVRDTLPEHCGTAVLVIDDGEVIFRCGYGLADAETDIPVTPETNFRIASVSKQFTATAVMLMVELGRISLDDTLDRFFPGFPDYGRQITVRHVLNHTSGLPDYEDLVPEGTTLQLHDRDVLKIILDTDAPLFEPGTKYQYSNTGYALLALIVEQTSGVPFHAFVRDRMFKPCGMDRSVVFVRGLNEVPNRAFGHKRENGAWVRSDQSVTSAVLGDGGVYSSIDDLHRWVRALHAEKLLSAASYEVMYDPPEIAGRSTGYGFGWRVDTYKGERRYHHTGSTRGFSLCLQRYPDRNAAVIVLINNSIDGKMMPVADRVADALLFND